MHGEGTSRACREGGSSWVRPPPEGTRGRRLGQQRDGCGRRAGERLKSAPASGGGGLVRRSRAEGKPRRELLETGVRPTARPGRSEPGRPVNGGFRVAAEAGRGAGALLTGARGRLGAAAGLGRASQGRRRLTLAAPCPGLRPRKWRARGTAALADTGDRAAQAPLTRKSSGPAGDLGLATARPAPRRLRCWGGRSGTAPRPSGPVAWDVPRTTYSGIGKDAGGKKTPPRNLVSPSQNDNTSTKDT